MRDMDKLNPIKIPLINPNEPEALLASLEVSEGDPVEKGQVLAVIETTKSTGEIVADFAGYFVGMRFAQGETLQAGETLAYIGATPNAQDSSLPPWAAEETGKPEPMRQNPDLRITEPARKLAEENGLDLNSLPKNRMITRQMVFDALAGQTAASHAPIPEDENRLIIYGAGGHGRSLAALVRTSGIYEVIGFLDDGYPAGEKVLGLTILGGGEKLVELAEEGIRMAVNGVGGIGDLQIRLNVYHRLDGAGFHIPTVIHPTAFLEDSTSLSDGVQVFPFAYLGTEVSISSGCIINTGAIVSHNCSLAPYVNLSPGAILAGGVSVGDEALIGMGATINLNVRVGSGARIGNDATIKADVPDGGVVPAGSIWPARH